MKKIIVFSIVILCLPMIGYAFTSQLTDSQLDQIYGQAGVTITFEDLFVQADFDAVSWGDSDGFSGNSNDAARIRIDGDFKATFRMPGKSVFTTDISPDLGIVMSLPENFTIDVSIPAVMKISVLPGADPQFDVEPTSSQVLGYLQLNNPTMTVTPSTVVALRPH